MPATPASKLQLARKSREPGGPAAEAEAELVAAGERVGEALPLAATEGVGVLLLEEAPALGEALPPPATQARSTMEPGAPVWPEPGTAPPPCSSTLLTRLTPRAELTKEEPPPPPPLEGDAAV